MLPMVASASLAELATMNASSVITGSYISSAWAVRTDSDVEFCGTVLRPDLARIGVVISAFGVRKEARLGK